MRSSDHPGLLRLPAHLAETTHRVDEVVSPDERMPCVDRPGYLAVGESALKIIRLALIAARRPDPTTILDLPCGHGRVTRWLRAAYPAAQITVSDLLADGVDFCAQQFDAAPVVSVPSPAADLFPDRYDLIWVGSLLTHVDVPQWDHFIGLFHELLAPDGVLVLTVHGELVAERMRTGHHYGYPAPGVARMIRAYEHARFGFLEQHPSSVDYGITVSHPTWVLERVLRLPDLRLVLYTEALWANHQDVVAVTKRPIEAGWANDPRS